MRERYRGSMDLLNNACDCHATLVDMAKRPEIPEDLQTLQSAKRSLDHLWNYMLDTQELVKFSTPEEPLPGDIDAAIVRFAEFLIQETRNSSTPSSSSTDAPANILTICTEDYISTWQAIGGYMVVFATTASDGTYSRASTNK